MRDWVVVAIMLLAAIRIAGAQVDASVQLGAAGIRFHDSASVKAAVVSSSFETSSQAMALGVNANLSAFDSRTWNANGRFDASALSPRLSLARGELHAYGDGASSPESGATHAVGAGARLHIGGDWSGVWAGSSVGTASDGVGSNRIRSIETGAWFRTSAVSAHVAFSPTRLGSRTRYDDLDASLRFEGVRFDAIMAAGVRRFADSASQAWAQGSAILWVHPRVGVTVTGGRFAADLAQGYPAGSYISAGIRLALARRHRSVPLPDSEVAAAGERAIGFELLTESDGRYKVVLAIAARDSVALMGDFTDWLPVSLSKRDDGRWEGAFALAPGIHELNVRVDGGVWAVPAGLASRRNDLDETVAILIVPDTQM